MVAYSSIGHMGFILLGTAVATPVSLLRYGADGQPRTDLRSAVLARGVVYAKPSLVI